MTTILTPRGIAERKKMINRKLNLPLVQQCKALKIHRTTIYREPKPVNQDQLDLMKLIYTIHLDEPSLGVRKVRQYLILIRCNDLSTTRVDNWLRFSKNVIIVV